MKMGTIKYDVSLIYNYAKRYNGDVEEIISMSLFKYALGLDGYKKGENSYPNVLNNVKWEAMNFFRVDKKHNGGKEKYKKQLTQPHYDETQRYALLKVAVEKLDDIEKDMIKKYYFDKYSLLEIAQETGRGTTDIQRIHKRAYKKIKRIMEYYDSQTNITAVP